MGDSLATGQGGDYEQGFAVVTAKHLSAGRQIKIINVGVGGARASDLATKQLPQVLALKPDLVLVSVGGNDVTHLTPLLTLKKQLETLVTGLLGSNCQMKIVLTGSPDMGGVPRFLRPLRDIAGIRSNMVNEVFDEVIKTYQLTWAPLSKETGPSFRKDPSLFAPDKFHPNNRGYDLMIQTLNRGLDLAISDQPSHCP